ncbi:MAG TPA: SRPBCC family protein [Bryobacteraceae bacterium]|jgi:uncharacterized membrane protein
MQTYTSKSTNGNIGKNERWISVAGGGILAALGIARRSWGGAALAAAGGALIWRGVRAQCPVKQALQGSGPVRIERIFTVTNKSPEEVFEFWRSFENLPKIMKNLESVRILDGRRSHWTAKGPGGKSIEWDAEITNERSGYLIEWRSLPGSDLDISGAVRFARKHGRGTKVHLSMRYTTPGGAIGEALANLLHERPEERIDEGLQELRGALDRV